MGRRQRKAAYVVFKGKVPGIYHTWEDCNEQVFGVKRNKQVGYDTLAEAERAWESYQIRSPPEISPPIRCPPDTLETNFTRPLKRARESETMAKENGELAREVINILDSDEEEEIPPPMKKGKVAADLFEEQANFIKLEDFEGDGNKLIQTEEKHPFTLTASQQTIVAMAVAGHNIFLTGAAGSGKTATLKEILRLLRKKYKDGDDTMFPAVQVVAPTGIAALPLNGRTTYSFAGWSPDSPKKSFNQLLFGVTKRVRNTMDHLSVLIIEEISMVEHFFLERLNLYMQEIIENKRPFGGKQIIFVGDFHQLPPVKPFENCILCGEPMEVVVSDESSHCETTTCKEKGKFYALGDKWAFKAPVWKSLHLRHVKLEQIHRQKDASFQSILNKIRNGQPLEDGEWTQLTLPKKHRSAPMRLMSLLRSVDRVNTEELRMIRNEEKSWSAYDEGQPLGKYDTDNPCPPHILKELEMYMRTLHESAFPTTLRLKVGAKIVLLSNLDLKAGLVNGTQGEIVKFVDTEGWEAKISLDWTEAKTQMVHIFQTKAGYYCPVVRFANGMTKTIFPAYLASLRGPSSRRCLVSRTQIPIKLAWALSIHKSQGMTLENVTVSRKHLFANGQLYVGLSRATTIEGLTVTDYSREQFTVESADEDVVRFYTETCWEYLGPSNMSLGQVGQPVGSDISDQKGLVSI